MANINGTAANDTLNGTPDDDLIQGFEGDDEIIASQGNDTLDGGAGWDFVRYGNATASVQIDLQAGTATGGAGSDTLISIQEVEGSAFDDVLLGSSAGEQFLGNAGNDHIDGRGGNDTVDYRYSPAAVTINLALGQASDGYGGTDTLVSLENAFGSAFNDVITGDASDNYLRGRAGDDTLDGAGGSDTADYRRADGSVVVSLLTNTASGADGNDVLISIENIRGSDFADILTGSDSNNLIQGLAGDDSLIGGRGNDTLRGGAGDDTLDGGEQLNLAWKSGHPLSYSDYDTADYSDVTVGGMRLDLANMTVTGFGGSDVGTDVLRGIESVRGTRQTDSVVGNMGALSGTNEGAGDQHSVELVLFGGSDSVVQSTIVNTPWVDGVYLSYWWSNTAINVVFTGSDGTVSYGTDGGSQLAGTDNLQRVDLMGDTRFSDTFDFSGMTGNHVVGERFNYVQLDRGDDTVIGNGDTQVALPRNNVVSSTGLGVNVQFAPAGVVFTVDMTHLTLNGTSLGTKTLSSIDSIRGTHFADTLVGGAYDDFESFRGFGGDDFIDGGSGFDRSDYFGASSGVTVNLAAGTASGDSSIGNDSLRSIEAIRGTALDDVYDARGFSGTSVNAGSLGDQNRFDGRGGNDTIFGNGSTRIEYSSSAVAVEVNLGTGKAWALNPAERTGALGQMVGEDTFTGVYSVRGTALGDLLVGGGHGRTIGNVTYETFLPGAGNDTVDGQDGLDWVAYGPAKSAISVDMRLASGQVQDGDGGVDTLLGIEGISGSDFDDVMVGSDTNLGLYGAQELFYGGKGNDTINGGGGYDEANYQSDQVTSGVVVNLGTGQAEDGFGTVDTLINIEGVEGSNLNDLITGDAGDNRLDGRGGDDTLDGAGGQDWAEYDDLNGGVGVQVNLLLGTATGGAGNDTLISIENVQGSIYADTLIGDDSANILEGLGGNDTIDGLAGLDTANYGQNLAAYILTAGSGIGNNTISGPDGNDSLASIERLNFADINLAFDIDTNAGQVYRLYQAAFNRTPDLAGLGGWIGAMDNGMALLQIASSFMSSAEFQSLYGVDPSNDAFVANLYTNALHRPAGQDAGGVDYWVNQLVSSLQTKAQALVNFSESPENKASVLPAIVNGITYATADQAAGLARGQTYAGTANDDSFIGTVGPDTFTGGAGNDSIDGGKGLDTAIYSGPRASHTIAPTSTGLTVSGGADGTDTLTNVERLKFDDVVLAFDTAGNAGQTYRLYQAAFNRTPDKAGLTDWVKGMDTGLTLTQVAHGFIASSEFQGLYGANPSNTDFINLLYNNVLQRAADQGGADYWNNQLGSGVSKEQVLIGFSESAENQLALIGVIQNGIELAI